MIRVRRDYSDGIVEDKAILREGKLYFIVEVSRRLDSDRNQFYPKHENHAPRSAPMTLKQAKEQIAQEQAIVCEWCECPIIQGTCQCEDNRGIAGVRIDWFE